MNVKREKTLIPRRRWGGSRADGQFVADLIRGPREANTARTTYVECRAQQIWERLSADPQEREWGGLRREVRIQAEDEYDRLFGPGKE